MKRRRVVAALIVSQVALLLAGSLWYRVSQLQSYPRHWPDESYYGLMAQALVQGEPVFTRTSSGNIPDPFFVALLVPMHLCFGASLTVLRMTAAICGIAAVLLLWRLGRKVLDPPTAIAAALMLGTAPVAIVYSRMACEFSQTPFIGVIAAYWALRGHGLASLLTLLVGLLIHPTNIFLIPCWLPVYLVQACRTQNGDRAAQIRTGLRAIVAIAALAAPFVFWAKSNGNVGTFAKDSRNPLVFLENFVWFLTMHESPGRFPQVGIWVILGTLGLLLILAVRRLIQRRQWERLALLFGWLVMLMAFNIQAGAEVLLPLARYGLVLLVPTALAAGVVFRAVLPEVLEVPKERGAWLNWRLAPVLGVGWLFLAITHAHLGHPPCKIWDCSLLWKPRTADIYDQILDRILADAQQREPDAASRVDDEPFCRIWAQEYFLNGLIFEYLASDRADVEVRSLLDLRSRYWRRLDQPDCFARESETLREALEAGDYVITEDSPPEMGSGLPPLVVGNSIPMDHLHYWRLPTPSGPMIHLYRLREEHRPSTLASEPLEDVRRR